VSSGAGGLSTDDERGGASIHRETSRCIRLQRTVVAGRAEVSRLLQVGGEALEAGVAGDGRVGAFGAVVANGTVGHVRGVVAARAVEPSRARLHLQLSQHAGAEVAGWAVVAVGGGSGLVLHVELAVGTGGHGVGTSGAVEVLACVVGGTLYRFRLGGAVVTSRTSFARVLTCFILVISCCTSNSCSRSRSAKEPNWADISNWS